MKVCGIVLAAGKSSRFGENKLKTRLAEKSVLEYTLEKLDTLNLCQCIVVANADTMPLVAAREGIRVVYNDYPSYGISYSIRLALQQGDTYDAYLFVVGDQPLMKVETIQGLLDAYKEEPSSIWGVGYEGVLGNPMIFPSKYKPELMLLEGDRGGKALLKKYHLPYKTYTVQDEEELWDMDTPKDYERIKGRI
ncbi:MAG: nucleotidyltransferase family protein [Cellulosilyticaceae bacterium]